MPIQLHDRYQMDDAAKINITKDGYLTATPRVARTGIQLYYGSELGLPDSDPRYNKIMKVYRAEDEVFSTDSMASYAYKPMTDNHPPVNVSVNNWKDYARGQMSGDVARDGQFIRVPMALMDGGLVQKFREGKKELSMGYDCEIDWSSGTALIDGATYTYDARQKDIRINHCAVVDAARGGKDLRIGDGTGSRVDFNVYAMALEAVTSGKIVKGVMADKTAAHLVTDAKGVFQYPVVKDGEIYLDSLRANKADAVTRGDGDAVAALDNLLSRAEGTSTGTQDAAHTMELPTMKLVQIDSIPVEFVNDQGAAIVQRALDTANAATKLARDAANAAEAENERLKKQQAGDTAKATTDIAAKDAEIVTLKKAVEDAKITPAMLDTMVKDRAEIVGKAKTVLGDKLVVDGKTVTEIMRQVVDAKLAEKAKGWTDEQIKISFDTMMVDVKPAAGSYSPAINDMQQAFGGQQQVVDKEKLIDARDKRTSEAWKQPQKVAV